MNLESIILGFLNDEPMSGYDISKRMDVSVGFFWHATHPQIYTTLKNLKSKGFVVSKYEIQTSSPNKKIYTITPEGKRDLLKNLANNIPPLEGKFPLLVAMFFGAELGREFWMKSVKSQMKDQQAKLSIYLSIDKQIPDLSPQQDLKTYLRKRTLKLGIGNQEQFLKWLNETLEILKS